MANKRAPFINRDQLAIYATNHRGSLLYQLITAGIFLILKHRMYGMPIGVFAWAMEGCIVALCLFMLFQQISLYKKILALGRKLREVDVSGYMNQICINKLVYMIPWLALLFQPLQVANIYPHLLGYFFVFAVTATYASASAALLPLLAFDVGIPAIFGLAVAGANWQLPEVRYVALGIVAFVIYAFIVSASLRKTTMRLIDARRHADDANRAKSSFLALMSHEIRTPMTGIFGMIDFLKETKLTDDQRSFIVTISECSKTLLNTLNDILDFSKIESGKLGISKINFQFHATLENSARILTQIAEDKGLALVLNISPDVPKDVYGDPHRIQQVVMNLVNNAVKFTQAGSVTINAVLVDGPKPMLKVEVTDTGIGISNENIGKLFSAFSQADSSISRKYGGSGLGLSIAKSLVGLMGGHIDVSSVEGKGSTFWFDIPYETPHKDEATVDAGALNAELPPMNILVAEDNAINARVISHLLSTKGHHVTVVKDGGAAVSAVKIHPYSLILMDVNMPVMNGIDATRAIRGLGSHYTRIPIIGLTANILDEYVRKCYAAGMNAYVAKPFSPEALLGAMVNVMKSPDEKAAAEATAANAAPDAPAQPTTGYTVVGQKKVLNTGQRTMEEVLVALRNELGLDYLKQTISNDTDDVQKLFAQVADEFKSSNFEKLGKAAHDLKSTSGLIGMQQTSALASTIQDDCLNGQHDNLGDLVTKLGEIVPAEAAAAREIALRLPEA